LQGFFGPGDFEFLHRIGLDLADGGEGGVEKGGEIPRLFLDLAGNLAHALAKARKGIEYQRKNNQRGCGQTPVGGEHHADQHHGHQRILDQTGDRLAGGLVQQRGIDEKARDQPPRRLVIVIAEIGINQMAVQIRLNIGGDALGDAIDQISLPETGQGIDEADDDKGDRDQNPPGRIALDQGIVHGILQHFIKIVIHKFCRPGRMRNEEPP